MYNSYDEIRAGSDGVFEYKDDRDFLNIHAIRAECKQNLLGRLDDIQINGLGVLIMSRFTQI